MCVSCYDATARLAGLTWTLHSPITSRRCMTPGWELSAVLTCTKNHTPTMASNLSTPQVDPLVGQSSLMRLPLLEDLTSVGHQLAGD